MSPFCIESKSCTSAFLSCLVRRLVEEEVELLNYVLVHVLTDQHLVSLA